MNRKKSFELNEEMVNKIISVAYRDASLREKLIVKRTILQNREARKLFNSFKQTADKVKRIAEEDCPEDLIKQIELKNVTLRKSASGFLFDFYSIILGRPIVSAGTTLVLVAAIVVALIVNKPVQYNYKYSESEIINADKQARQALAIVGNFFKQTQSTLQNEILSERVAKLINDGIGIVNNLFEGETK
mgnify:CR=1 FL=1